MDRTSLSGKRVLVTGGTTGIGRATVALLAKEGAHIVTFGRHQEDLDIAIDHAQKDAATIVHGLVADVTTSEGVAAAFDAVDKYLGGLDVLINNAAISVDGVQAVPTATWRYAVETDFVGYLACTDEALRRMTKAASGHLVFVGSISAHRKSPGSSVYAGTKAGIAAYAETLRKEVAAANVKVTLIEPGAVGADMQDAPPEAQRKKIAAEEMLYAEDIADAITYVLTRPSRTDVATVRIEPRLQSYKDGD